MVAVMAPMPDGPVVRPRPVLRLVDDVTWLDDVDDGDGDNEPGDNGTWDNGSWDIGSRDIGSRDIGYWEADDRAGPDDESLGWLNLGTDVAVRRRRRAAGRIRRRRILTGAAVAAALVLLALPLRPLAGRPLAATTATPPLIAGSEYVVQPGDTLWTIATRLQPSADPRSLVAQLEDETGSDHLVPGEHLRLP